MPSIWNVVQGYFNISEFDSRTCLSWLIRSVKQEEFSPSEPLPKLLLI